MILSLALLALCGSTDAGIEKQWVTSFNWDLPQIETIVPIGNTLQAQGAPQKIFLAKTKMKLADAIDHYAERFIKLGYFIPPTVRKIEGFTLPRVVAFDSDTYTGYLVYGWPEPDGTTTLILGATDLRGKKEKPKEEPKSPVVFPGSKNVTKFNLEGARAIAFSAAATETEVISYYRTVLPTLGYTEREPGTFVKDNWALRVLARPEAKSKMLGVVVLEQPDNAMPEFPSGP
jgi:hypothetical protein